MLFPPEQSDSARHSQVAFRALMTAMAQPGTIQNIADLPDTPAPLAPATAVLLMALSDFETSIWLDQPLRDVSEVGDYIRFQTGSRLVEVAHLADFAVVADPSRMLRLSEFGQGTLEYPDRSGTVILQVETLHRAGWHLTGPGIRDTAHFSAGPVPADFVTQLAERTFPCGVDVIFAAGNQIAALPRSTRVSERG